MSRRARDPDQLELPGTRRAPAKRGPWERRAETLLRAMRAAETLTAEHAGYGDTLRMAGRDRDAVEADPDARAWDRAESRRGWDAALGRLIEPPTANGRGEDADPFARLDRELDAAARSAALRDTPSTRPPD